MRDKSFGLAAVCPSQRNLPLTITSCVLSRIFTEIRVPVVTIIKTFRLPSVDVLSHRNYYKNNLFISVFLNFCDFRCNRSRDGLRLF